MLTVIKRTDAHIRQKVKAACNEKVRSTVRVSYHYIHVGLHMAYFGIAFAEHVGLFSYVCGALMICSFLPERED